MTYRTQKTLLLIVSLIVLSGCQPHKPAYRLDRGDLSYYVDQATEIAYPDLDTPILEEVTHSYAPITNSDAQFESFWDLSLEDSVAIALQNSKVIRGFGSPGLQGIQVAAGVDSVVNGPAGAGTIYDVAVRETEAGFIGIPGQIAPLGSNQTNTALDSNQGVEAALADFDAQLTSNLSWARSDQPRNVAATGLIFTPSFFQQDLVNWTTQLAKRSANGTQFFARNVWTYTANTIPATVQPLQSVYQTAFEFEVRQPLLRGRGTFINRLPIVISRINTDQVATNFESVMQNMVTNVEIRYWDLHCAYRNLEGAKVGRDAALDTYQTVNENFKEGKVAIQDQRQAQGQYFFFRSQVEQAWVDLLLAESNFRWLLGVASNDQRLVRPVDEPTKARVNFDYHQTMDEALCFRPELRNTRWEVKKRQLALQYSKNSLLPNLNASALYRWLGLGDDFINFDDSVPLFPNDRSAALNEFFNGDFQEVEFNLDFGLAVGFRRELSDVRNAQVKLARELARLEDSELDVEREISQAIQAMEANYQIARTAFNSWSAYNEEYKARKERYLAGTDPITFLLDAQRSRTQGEAQYFQALCEYNKLIALIHRRKGTILAYNNIFLNEGAWPGKAYDDANEHARRRGAARQVNYGFSRPQVISRGPIQPPPQNHGTSLSVPGGEVFEFAPPVDQLPGEVFPLEEVPASPNRIIPNGELPAPTPASPSLDGSASKNVVPTSRQTQVVHPRLSDQQPTQQSASTVVRAGVDWNRFGMTPPDGSSPSPAKPQAVIRQVSHEEPVRR